jgi:hypothetical protein
MRRPWTTGGVAPNKQEEEEEEEEELSMILS